MSETEEVSIHQTFQAVIVLVSGQDEYDASTLFVQMYLMGNAEHENEDSGSCREMMIDDTRMGSYDCYTEGWGGTTDFY